MKFDARDYRWGTSLSKRVYFLIFLLYFHRIPDCCVLCVLLAALLSDYALIGATHSACPLWFIESGRNKRNNLITDFRKSNTDYSAQMFVYFGLIRHFLIKTVVDDYYWMPSMRREEGEDTEKRIMFFVRLKYWFTWVYCLIFQK